MISALRHLSLLAAALGAAACSARHDAATAPSPLESTPAPVAPIAVTPSCAAGMVEGERGDCIVPAAPSCATGFRADGRGACEAILPAACPAGQMAIPGESACHEVMECGTGTWGDIPDSPTTLHVDASYRGATTDGTRAHPYRAIVDAVKAAASGSTIAIAAGTYDESVLVRDKHVAFRGVCPAQVTVRSPSDGNSPAFGFGVDSDGSSLSGVAISQGLGILHGAGHLTVDHVWIHDTVVFAVGGQSQWGLATMDLRDALVEGNVGPAAIADLGIEMLVERTVVRGTSPDISGVAGRPVSVETGSAQNTPGKLTLRACVLEKSADVGLMVEASQAIVEGTVIREITPAPDAKGRGIVVQTSVDGRGKAVVRGSIVERTQEVGIVAIGSDLELEDSVVRDTAPTESGALGNGVQVEVDPKTRVVPTIALRRVVVERNHSAGIGIVAGKGSIEDVVVRGTQATPNGAGGMGIVAQFHFDKKLDKAPLRSSISIARAIVDDNRVVGIAAVGSDVSIESARISNTKRRASDDNYGDGVTVLAADVPASLVMKRTSLEGSPRAGLSNFGASAHVENSRFRCNQFDLNGESVAEHPFVFESAGTNRCGCDAEVACRAVSAELTPPPAAR